MVLSPFDNPVPNGYIEKIRAYARDLAWGVTQEYWDTDLIRRDDFYLVPVLGHLRTEDKKLDSSNAGKAATQFLLKWFPENNPINAPKRKELNTWGFVNRYELQRSAFDLLVQPIKAPSVFISYRRAISSAFALAIEARLHVVGHRDVFVDKDIEAGAEWFNVLEQRISECDYFVLLVDNDVFGSKWMLDEFNLAIKLNKTIIPIIHPEADINKFSEFNKIQAIECRGKASAASYEDAINRLLNRLGYSTF
jgi:hypothetical protein